MRFIANRSVGGRPQSTDTFVQDERERFVLRLRLDLPSFIVINGQLRWSLEPDHSSAPGTNW